jgi:hypothetical protein
VHLKSGHKRGGHGWERGLMKGGLLHSSTFCEEFLLIFRNNTIQFHFVQGSYYCQIRGRDDFSFRELSQKWGDFLEKLMAI